MQEEARLTQADVEARMYGEGAERSRLMFARAEERGRAGDASYANRIYREYVVPLGEVIREAVKDAVPGVARAHVGLLAPLDPETVAFLAVRTALGRILGPKPMNHRTLAYAIGKTIHRELVLVQLQDTAPDLYAALAHDFSRRMSKDERHRLQVFRMQAKKNGIEIAEWGIGSRDQVGLYLLGCLEQAGMIELTGEQTQGLRYKREYFGVVLSEHVMQTIDAVKSYLAETQPAFGPCVDVPRDWTSAQGGGFHTEALRRVHRSLVKVGPTARAVVRQHPMPTVLAAVNALQRTAWEVNADVLRVLMALAESGREVAGVVTPHYPDRPPRPRWMDTVTKEDMTPYQAEELRQWKHVMRNWYEGNKLRAANYGRFYTCTRQANTFVDQGPLYFVYFLDSRGRAYPMTYGLNPQGDDMQKGLLRFHRGLPVHTESAEKWFLIQGANKWGFDKAPLAERRQWALDREELILAIADAPLDNQDWLKADAPLQFLAWCFEFARWRRDPGFLSHLPVSMDGSCNGLQHFSAMLRDPVGAEATNLAARPEMQDIYARVAEATMRRLQRAPASEDGLREFWLKHGVNRSVVKRSVMTTPYGVTQRSATDYVISDYLASVETGLDRKQWRAAAIEVMSHTWPAIGEVVVAAREAMGWLKRGASRVIKQQVEEGWADPMIAWETPSGFLATQTYFDQKVHRIRSLLHGDVRLRVVSESDEPDMSRHAAGLAPNFVHSVDAAHLHLVAAAAGQAGIHDLAMIHDDYGTHAANAEKLFHLIREKFVWMYENHDPLRALAERYPAMGEPPKAGDFDIREVLASDYFFS